MDLNEQPHRRYNALTGEWILVSPHRTNRPWEGQVEPIPAQVGPPYDPECYLCPGNTRAGGHRNPAYTGTFVFDNDFPALLPDTAEGRMGQGLLIAQSERGVCRVICFSPDHSLTLARMTVEQIIPVVGIWTTQYAELLGSPHIRYVQIFENRGEMMGCSNPHPHCQIWASESLPNEIVKERNSLGEYSEAHQACLLCDYVSLERSLGERIICENESFTALVPFWAVWPFEILLLSRRHITGLDQLTDHERCMLAAILKSIGGRFDNLFAAPFPYTMGFHQRPAGGDRADEWHLHAHYYPPLLRSATIRKFMVGYEMLASPQRDITPEEAAARLRNSAES